MTDNDEINELLKLQADQIANLKRQSKPFIWMDDCGTWFTNEAYQNLDNDLKDGLFPLYK